MCNNYAGTGNDTSPPFNIEQTTEMDRIIVTWSQEDDFIIDHYKIQLNGSEQPILVKERKHIFPAGTSNFNGNLSAVNVCGEESDEVSFILGGYITLYTSNWSRIGYILILVTVI